MSAITGIGDSFTIRSSALTSSSRGTAQRTRSPPASAMAWICFMVASKSAVSVLVMDCTATGAPPPIFTPPTSICFLEAMKPGSKPSWAILPCTVSRENVERLREAFEGFLRHDTSRWGPDLLDPDVVWDATNSHIFDISRVYHGAEGVAQFWREWLGAWETVQFEYELIHAGDQVVALVDQRMRGRSTEIEVPLGKYA